MLEACNLEHRTSSGKIILSGVSAHVERGEVLVGLGPSGSGKTSLIRSLALLDDPNAGTLRIDGDVFNFPRAVSERRRVGPWPTVTVVFQSLFLFPHLTLRENIMLPVRKRLCASRRDWISHGIRTLHLETAIDRYPNEASLGERQRVALLRGLALEPRYLLLDEVTSALDVEQIAAVSTLLREAKQRKTGIFLVTHLLGFARDLGDRYLFMEHGEVLEQNPIDRLAHPDHPRLRQFVSQVSAH